MRHIFIALVALVSALFVVGCKQAHTQTTAPNLVVKSYFEALYNEQDFNKALSYASQSHKAIMESYGTPMTVGRYLYNMSFEQAEIHAERPSGMTYRGDKNSLRVDVAIRGYKDGKRYDEVREVVVVFEEGSWRVDRMLNSQY